MHERDVVGISDGVGEGREVDGSKPYAKTCARNQAEAYLPDAGRNTISR